MATQINVTVDRGGLVERNRQQTKANRQARLEQDAQNTTAAEAQQQRAERLAAEEAFRSTSQDQRLGQEPAAFRFGGRVFIGPRFAPVLTEEPNVRVAPDPESLTGNGTRYITGTDWTVSNFVIEDTKFKTAVETVSNNRGFYEAVAYEESHYRITFTLVGGVFVRQDVYLGAITQTVLFDQGAGPGGANAINVSHQETGDIINGSSIVLSPDYGDLPATQARCIVSGPMLTAEFYLRLSGSTSQLRINFGNIDINIPADQEDFQAFVAFPGLSLPTSFFDATTADFAEWTHVAYVFKSQTFTVFINGISVASVATSQQTFSQGVPTIIQDGYRNTSFQLLFSSLRIVPKALYSANFTPPSVIR